MGPQIIASWDRLRSLFIRLVKNNGISRYCFLVVIGMGCLSGLIKPAYAVTWHTYSEALAACKDFQPYFALNPSHCTFVQYYSQQGHYQMVLQPDGSTSTYTCNQYTPDLCYFEFTGTCTAGTKHTDIWLPGDLIASGTAPNYVELSSSPCQCNYIAQVAWRNPDKTYGVCYETGNLSGDYSNQQPANMQPPSMGDQGNCNDELCLNNDGSGQHNFCMTSDGHTVCTPASTPGGEPGQNIPANCALGDGIAVCVGVPDAPLPNWTPVPPAIQSRDGSAVQADGSVVTFKVDAYDTTGQGNNASSGDGSTSAGSTGNGGNNGSQGAGDQNGTCANGMTPSAGGCNAGYTDNGCDAPPTCSGDPLLCAQLREQHASRCSAQRWRDTVSTARSTERSLLAGSAAQGEGDSRSPSEAWADGIVGSDGSGGGSSSSPPELTVHRFWAQSSCPGIPDPGIPGLDIAKVAAPLCTTGSYLASLILAMGYALGTLIFARTVSSD